MKRILTAIAAAVLAAWVFAAPAAAQGRSQGHGAGAGGSMSGMHDHDTSGSPNANASSNAPGPRSPSELLSQNKELASKLSSLLPPGTDLQAAADGFKNLGQFVAAVHVSHNLDIPFATLKCTELAMAKACPSMTVPSKSSSLGQAIHTLKPDMSSAETKSAAKQAEKEASGDMHATS